MSLSFQMMTLSLGFHSDDDFCLFNADDILPNIDDGIDRDAHITDGDVELRSRDVQIGCLIWVRIPDDLCLNDDVIGLQDELVEVDYDQRDAQGEVGFEVVDDVALEVDDEVLDVKLKSIVDVWSNVYEVDVQLWWLIELNADDRVDDVLVKVMVHDANHSEVVVADVNVWDE